MSARSKGTGPYRVSPRLALAIEAACLAPALGLLVLALVSWSGQAWYSRQVQHIADAALAAAVAEADVAARESRARAAAERALATRLHLPPGAMRLSLVSHSQRLTVLLVCDADRRSRSALGWLTPASSPTIVRQASGRVRAA